MLGCFSQVRGVNHARRQTGLMTSPPEVLSYEFRIRHPPPSWYLPCPECDFADFGARQLWVRQCSLEVVEHLATQRQCRSLPESRSW
jgi:hypothetical protein